MNTYVVTYVSEEDAPALSLTLSLGNDEQARQFASRTAQRVHGVTLETVDSDGVVAKLARWLDGALSRANGVSEAMTNLRTAAEYFVTATDETEDEVSDDDLAITEADVDALLADDPHHFEGRCMHCQANRAFIGRVRELPNGSKQARGTCPVCGTTIVRMVTRTTPVDEWEDDPEVVSEVEAEAEAQDETAEDIQDEIAEAISEATEGEPIAEVADATAALAMEFSNAADEVEAAKPAPRKRAPRKANGKTANQQAAANPVKMKCPKCEQQVDTFERAGIRIFSLHGDEAKGLDRCPGSTTVVQ